MIELPKQHGLLIVAARETAVKSFRVYRWKDLAKKPEEVELVAPIPRDFRAEAALYDATDDNLWLFSDDGKRQVDAAGTECEDLPVVDRAFRAIAIPLALD